MIICGYGRSGQNLARMLEREGIPYMALDLDPDRVRQAAAAGQSVVFGDAARLQSLMAAGLARASAVVVSYHDTPSALKVLRLVHEHAPQVPVIVRTHRRHRPRAAARRRRDRGGARGDRGLADAGQPRAGAGRRADAARASASCRTSATRATACCAATSTAPTTTPSTSCEHARLASVTLPAGSGASASTLGRAGAARGTASAWCRCGAPRARCSQPERPLVLAAGDTLVLSGLPEALALAEGKLLRGRAPARGLASRRP